MTHLLRHVLAHARTALSAMLFAAFMYPTISMAGGESDALWIDVRTAEEFEAGHFEPALNIDFEVIHEHIQSVAPNRSQAIRLYCRSGRRSGIAQETLQAMGYTNVSNEGGLEEVLARNGGAAMLCCSTPTRTE